MSQKFFERHQPQLEQALAAAALRGYWSPFAESPSPRNYGETANDDGRAAFEALRGKPFPLNLHDADGTVGGEKSPYGFDLGITYPHVPAAKLVAASKRALQDWRRAGPQAWVGVSLEILARLNKLSFEMAYAVQHTTGQGFMMAFQAGGPHAQDRGFEAVAYAWQEMSRIPGVAIWEKPQGKNDPIRMEKHFTVVPRGVALVIGCSTFPTWNGYPGLFASLATGNTVIVKPHPGAILPLALTVKVAREVLQEAGFDPDVVLLAAHTAEEDTARQLALDPAVKIIDFTGSTANGDWLENNARQALVYTEKAGVNQVIIDSAADLKGVARNLAFSLALYSGQMCTAPQNIYVPRDGIQTPEGRVSFDEVAAALGAAVDKLGADAAKAVELTGAIQNEGIVERIEKARALGLPVVADSKTLTHPQFENARVRTPLLLRAEAGNPAISQEWFGPIAFVVATDSTAHSIQIARDSVIEHGALSLSAYTTSNEVAEQVQEAAEESGVSLSLNLTGAVFVNQTAAFSDFHGTGANPAANAALSDSAYVSNRFRVVQTRRHI
ncbi:phenylacetic acid degradation protein PaaN [Achromobacter xylosoxidans]|uniref:phenylacetic acid degradation protein PaaN n=1 Tax=Alcaligenes xylosoxydans xylosoxydans TaxID=85698 RepID=UPI00033216CB|nr:phenylacetic acid degradation protein PaaN [Achromobacter xylosoxidans]MCH4579075.1 phenylacetic acid degradation protein PaaN [Achromobacter xylosoxidans]MCH4592890.1 phenylacetic acid degradation protein PaaN [Achromobacter xylosoxidans]MCM2571050.1 phenylacetic acid degradation protein PaaN [Achromobacter xylosoxidans]MCZ8439735.1 phenylacetic acid degradation protein PaaN [Achromobacter xylosoxidans]MDC6161321.1 phenylacetic acid degradation protein PaaN [Achromobacter xylosoxidans]